MEIWLSIAITLLSAGALAIPGVPDFSFYRLTPYSSLEFFLLGIPVYAGLFALRPCFRKYESWVGALEIVNALYFLIFFPQPVQLFFACMWFFTILMWRRKNQRFFALQCVLLLLPLLLHHKTAEIRFWGLSYATFRAFHLLMDDELLKTLNFRRYFHFTFYFPSLLAGPIDRLQNFRRSLENSWTAELSETWSQACGWLIIGLVQKFILAELIQRYWLPAHLTTGSDWVRSFYGEPLYIYLDFAGYSAIAIGFSLMAGVKLPLNFDRPYLSSNPQDFWRRFHITLGEWLRDYFFKPIYKASVKWPWVGNRPLMRQNIAVFLTFFLMGAWNGTQKQYLISGSLFGIYSVAYTSYIYYAKRTKLWEPPLWLSRVIMVHLAALALFIFSGTPFRS